MRAHSHSLHFSLLCGVSFREKATTWLFRSFTKYAARAHGFDAEIAVLRPRGVYDTSEEGNGDRKGNIIMMEESLWLSTLKSTEYRR